MYQFESRVGRNDSICWDARPELLTIDSEFPTERVRQLHGRSGACTSEDEHRDANGDGPQHGDIVASGRKAQATTVAVVT